MRLTVLLFFIAMLNVSAATLAQQVTLHEKNASMEKVFNEIEKQTGYNVFYSAQVLKDAPKVDVDFEQVPLEQALNTLLKDKPLTFKIIQQTIVVKLKEEAPSQKASATLSPIDVIGRVTNTAGQPLDGASVTIKRTQTGVLTNPNGLFKISGVYQTDTLYISYVGYARAVVRIGNEINFKIVLKETTNTLDQVVVQAYGETSQRLATGDIGTVTAKQIERQPVMNVLDAIQGQVPGAIVTNVSGYASGNVNIEIRGRANISNIPSNPLIIIDGVPVTISDLQGSSSINGGGPGVTQSGISSPAGAQSPLFGLNPNDVESISILKDADATAIYGSRGANGVILITTKKGKAGKTATSISISQGERKATERFQFLNTQQYIAMREQALKNDDLPINISTAPDIVTGDPNRYTNWENYLWGGTGNYTDANVTLSGGDAQTTFRLSGGFQSGRDITTFSGGNYRASMNFNLDHKSLNQRLDLNLSVIYSYAVTDQISLPETQSEAPPNAPPAFDKDGNLNFAGWDAFYDGNGTNPFTSFLQPYTSSTNFLNTALALKYEIVKGLTFNTSFGYSNTVNAQTQFNPLAADDPVSNQTGQSLFGNTFLYNSIIEPHLEYNKVIGKSKLNALIGGSEQITNTTGKGELGYGYTNDALLTDIGAAPRQYAEYYTGVYKYFGLFFRLNYNWQDKFILNLNGRRDGSSRFGPGNQFGNFGSVGGAYIFSEEHWVKNNVPILSFGKIRASYGSTGSDQAQDYQFLTQWTFNQQNYNGLVPLQPQKHTDSLFHWQVNKKTEIAIDLGFFNDRILLNIDHYRDLISDELVFKPTPEFTGFTSVFSNLPGVVENTGWEFTATAKILDHDNFRWNVHFNIGINRNKLVSYPNLAQSPYASSFVIGQPLNIVHLLHYTGVDPQTGFYTFQDKNHDGQITYNPSDFANDDTHTVNISPKFDGGFTNEISYKNWELSAFFYFRKQIGTNALGQVGLGAGNENNVPVELLQNVWQRPGQIAAYARLTTEPYDQSFNNFQNSDAVYTDASFIRLQNLTLTYTFPKKGFLKNIGSGSVFVRGENLFVLTKYIGPDPEIQNFGALPLPLTITTGVSFTF